MKAFVANVLTIAAAKLGVGLIGFIYGYVMGDLYGIDYVMEICNNVWLWDHWALYPLLACSAVYYVALVCIPFTLIFGVARGKVTKAQAA